MAAFRPVGLPSPPPSHVNLGFSYQIIPIPSTEVQLFCATRSLVADRPYDSLLPYGSTEVLRNHWAIARWAQTALQGLAPQCPHATSPRRCFLKPSRMCLARVPPPSDPQCSWCSCLSHGHNYSLRRCSPGRAYSHDSPACFDFETQNGGCCGRAGFLMDRTCRMMRGCSLVRSLDGSADSFVHTHARAWSSRASPFPEATQGVAAPVVLCTRSSRRNLRTIKSDMCDVDIASCQ